MLKIDHLNFSYETGNRILSDISLDLTKGEKTALIGSNGCGKTTLFLLCCGVLKPERGTITAGGNLIHPGKFNPKTGYLFQAPDNQLFSPTVYDDVAFGPLNIGHKADDLQQRVSDALERTGCIDLAQRSPHHLSGGEKRMVAIATLLSMSPELLLFDEPTANLDSRNRRKVISLIQELNQTLFISSHDLEFLLETCGQAVLLDRGVVISSGPIHEVMSNQLLMNSCGLEVPHSLAPRNRQSHSGFSD